MKTIQKLELFAGVATLIATIAFIYFVDIPLSKKIAVQNNDSTGYHWIQPCLLLILPSLLIVISSYAHAFKESKIGFIVVVILSGTLSFLYAIGFLVGSAFEGQILIGISPGLFAFATLTFAIINIVWSFSERDRL